jgi:esterase/lipase superfamily enzyme
VAAPVLQHFEHPVTVTVQGAVIDDLGDAIQGATVNLLLGGHPVAKADSREDGAFSMIDLRLTTDIHQLRASSPGYVTSDETLVVTKDMSNSTKLITLRLNPVGWKDPSSDATLLRVGPPRLEERRRREQKYVTMEVFFATDRKFYPVTNLYQRFGSERAIDGALSLGSCQVSIPQGHQIGQLEGPFFKLQILENPSRHVVLLALDCHQEDVFFKKLSSAISMSPNHEAFVFIHGYNVTFGEAVRRTAQIAFDLGFQGAPICYSWPSVGEYSKYMADETSAEWTIPHLSAFLKGMRERSGADKFHLIAHSMGNRPMARTLQRTFLERIIRSTPKIRQIVLAAPDIDAGVFIELADNIAASGERTTLYASSNDLPLAISQQFHAYPRAGEGGPDIVVVQGVDTVDASSVPSGFLGHSYYAGTRTILSDLYELVRHGTPPPRFGLKAVQKGDLTYWEMQP